jgi:HAD superfamily hydrolase (TIGR01509 family)
MKAVRGVILDVDGTLVASNDAHAHAWVEAMAEYGIGVPFDRVRRMIGMGGDKLLPAACGVEADSAEGKRISQLRAEIFLDRYVPQLRPTPGAKDLLHYLWRQGEKLAVASSAKKDELQALLRVCGADEVIASQTSSDDAERSKPDPDIVHSALGQLGQPPEEVVMLGDTPYDIEAAGRARVGVIAVRCGGWGDKDLAGALAIYDDPADLFAHYETSPLAR